MDNNHQDRQYDYNNSLWQQLHGQQQQLRQAEEQRHQQEQGQQLILHGASTSGMIHSAYNMPPGYRFCPTDEVLIMSYLIPKVSKLPLPFDGILTVELYNRSIYELKDMYKGSELFKKDEWYFFTSRNRKYANGTRPNRSAVGGFWKPTGNERCVKLGNQPIGYKKSLDYCKGHQRRPKKTAWKMHEYRIDRNGSAPSRNANGEMNMQLDGWVLCKIYKSNRNSKGLDEQEGKGDSIMDANSDSDQTVQRNEAEVQNQNSTVVIPGPSTASAFAWPLGYEPTTSCSFQRFNQNSSFIDPRLFAGFNDNMFPPMANFPPMASAAHVEPNLPILASSDFNHPNMYMNMMPINDDIDDADLDDIMKDYK